MVDFHEQALKPIIEALGKPFSYTPPEAEEPAQLAENAKAVLHERHSEFSPSTVDATVSMMGSWLLVDFDDFPQGKPEQFGRFVIAGREFKATDVEETGNGGARVPLQEILA